MDETRILQWLDVKRQEDEAKAVRLTIESEIVAELGVKEEGSRTHQIGDYKITITGKLSYKADVPELSVLSLKLPPNLRPLKTITVLDDTGAKWLRCNEKELWSVIASAIEVKPAKPALTIKEA
jgi:hypothetical protein